MQSNNPVFTRSEGFNGRGNASVGSPSTWSTGLGQGSGPGGYGSYDQGGLGGGYAPAPQLDQGRMTIDSVVQKTGLSLGVVVLVAAATWVLTGDLGNASTAQGTLGTLYALSLVGSLGGFVLAMVNSFKKVISPALVLAYAAMQGLFVGAFSKVVEATFVGPGQSGLVLQAVAGTFMAVVGTLAAYKFFDIRVTPKFRIFVTAAMIGFVAVSLFSFVLSFFGAGLGVNGFGTVGMVFAALGVVLGVFMLIMDFDFVERGIEAGLPDRESWRAAFGLTVTIVWIYVQLLRLLAILRGND
ncbi:Uncharacterized membrane protein, YccA/Bax inhibitor family [Nocardioides scoriae]|uniref:Uncharacterized membrane protein, YccA/Bax inhibitor family n=1 Tax=Nocardioides scoriae TaxID=642780 RepID=A0A1H1SUK6_9ACTN|nr:Bax inhibitor-1/YccA family protein [Nocardioides scoriae]SDS51635.1 Uncharacterized membrane protein, YccA/Bax inhibitor family [Nocardioides scoriae]